MNIATFLGSRENSINSNSKFHTFWIMSILINELGQAEFSYSKGVNENALIKQKNTKNNHTDTTRRAHTATRQGDSPDISKNVADKLEQRAVQKDVQHSAM